MPLVETLGASTGEVIVILAILAFSLATAVVVVLSDY